MITREGKILICEWGHLLVSMLTVSLCWC